MKKSFIFGLLIIAASVGIIVASAGDASKYVTFAQAAAMEKDGDDSEVHVVGELTKNSAGEIVGVEYDPLANPNYLAFTMVDDSLTTHRVVCYNPPASMQDLKRSEKVVIIGRAKGKDFVASKILMKCPSKYEEKEIKG